MFPANTAWDYGPTGSGAFLVLISVILADMLHWKMVLGDRMERDGRDADGAKLLPNGAKIKQNRKTWLNMQGMGCVTEIREATQEGEVRYSDVKLLSVAGGCDEGVSF